jgi:hypothetical protein
MSFGWLTPISRSKLVERRLPAEALVKEGRRSLRVFYVYLIQSVAFPDRLW